MQIAPRHLWIRLAILAAALALGFGGCGPSVGSENGEVIAALSKAQDLLRQAHQGYQTGSSPKPDEEYRQALYEKAVQVLQTVKNEGTPTQQVAVQRLLAQLRLAQADSLTRLAVARWARLAVGQAQVSSLLLKAQQASLQRAAMRGDETQLQQALTNTQQELSQQTDGLRQQQTSLEQAIGANRDRGQAVATEADNQAASAQRLRDQAFVAQGQQRYDLELASLEAQRRANAALTERDSLDSELNLSLNPQLQVAQRQLQALEQMQQQAKQELEALRQRGQRASDVRRAAQQRAEAALVDLRQAWEQTLRTLQTEVQGNLDAAQQNAAAAVALAESAGRQAERRNDAKADLLAAQMQLAHTQVTASGVLSASAAALGQLAQSVEAVAGPSASYFVDSAGQVGQRAATARQAAKTSLAAARQTALQIAESAGEGTGGEAQQYLDRVQALEDQLAGRRSPRKFTTTATAPSVKPSASAEEPVDRSEPSPAEPDAESTEKAPATESAEPSPNPDAAEEPVEK